MKRLVFLAAVAVNYTLFAGGGGESGTTQVPNDDGKELAERLAAAVPNEPSDRHGVFEIKAGGVKKEIPVECKVTLRGATWEVIYETSNTPAAGAERLVIVHGTTGPNHYLYAKAPAPRALLPEAAPLAPEALNEPFGGSDFSIGELGLDFFHWRGQHHFINERRLGQPCFVLESTNDLKSGIVRVRSSIDEDNLGLLYAEAYDAAGNKVAVFSLDSKSFKKDAQGHGELREFGIDNLKNHSHTDLKFDTIKY